MINVFVVEHSYWEDAAPMVFSTEEKAWEYIESKDNEVGFIDHNSPYECEIDNNIVKGRDE
jgi:hypothetical protein